MKRIFCWFLILLFSGIPSALTQKTEQLELGYVLDVSDRNYFQKARELIAVSQKTVDIAAEVIVSKNRHDDPIAVLIRDLIAAQKRGVQVRLFLNTFTSEGLENSLFMQADLLSSLRHAGVEVHFVSPSYELKDQMMIIDGKEVLEGTLRWTKEDLEKGLGSATLIHSIELAEKKRIRLEFLPLWDIEQKKNEQAEGTVAVPFYLIHEMRYFPQMVIHDDGDALKIYLSLLRTFYQVQDIHFSISYEDLGREIPADQFFEPHAVTFQVVKTVERLSQDYGLIEVEKKEPDRVQVRMIFPSQNDAVIKVPVSFFLEGYAKALTPAAIFTYFVITYKTQISGEAPVWLGSEKNVEQDFPISEETFRQGVRELREKNLIEVFPFSLIEGYRAPGALEYRYLVNPIASMSERLETWDRLRNQFGNDSVRRAQELANFLGEPEDPKVIAVYLDLMNHFREEDIRAFTERIATLPPDSTPSTMNYLRTLLEHESKNSTHLVV